MTSMSTEKTVRTWRVTGFVAMVALSLATGACMETGESGEADVDVVDSEDAELQREVQALLDEHPGAKQLNDREVEIEQGAVVSLAPPDRRARAGSADCPYQNVCFYQGADYGYPRLKLYDCKQYHLTPMGWGDKISSWHNNQSGGAVATVWNWTGQWSYMFTAGVGSNHYVGAGHNDKADYIINCP
jgi:hypothetical protein